MEIIKDKYRNEINEISEISASHMVIALLEDWWTLKSCNSIISGENLVGLRQIVLKCFPSNVSVNLVTFMLANVCSSAWYQVWEHGGSARVALTM